MRQCMGNHWLLCYRADGLPLFDGHVICQNFLYLCLGSPYQLSDIAGCGMCCFLSWGYSQSLKVNSVNRKLSCCALARLQHRSFLSLFSSTISSAILSICVLFFLLSFWPSHAEREANPVWNDAVRGWREASRGRRVLPPVRAFKRWASHAFWVSCLYSCALFCYACVLGCKFLSCFFSHASDCGWTLILVFVLIAFTLDAYDEQRPQKRQRRGDGMPEKRRKTTVTDILLETCALCACV